MPDQAAPSTPARLMLVEDDLSMQSLLRTLLELEGFQVLVPSNQLEGELLATIVSEKPDVILLDVHLRDANGLDVLRKLRQVEGDAVPARHTRVIMTSGMDVSDQCLAAGADSFLLKPYMPTELIRKLKG